MTAEQLAVIVYGVTAYVAALVLAVMQGSALGAALVFAAAGLTYLFQTVQLIIEADGRLQDGPHHILDILMAAAIAAVLASVFVSLIFGG